MLKDHSRDQLRSDSLNLQFKLTLYLENQEYLKGPPGCMCTVYEWLQIHDTTKLDTTCPYTLYLQHYG